MGKERKGQSALEFLMRGNRKVSELRNSRGQSALEFLMTYGWAILIILVMIAALVYFGVFSPSKLTPERCTSMPGFGCSDYKLTPTTGQFKVQNAKGDSLNIPADSWAMSSSSGTCPCDDPTASWAADEIKTITCDDAACDAVVAAAVGDKQKVTVLGNYTPKGGGFTRQLILDVNALVSAS